MTVRREFTLSADSVGLARHFVVDSLASAGVTSLCVLDDAALAVTEMTTNALLHADTEFEVALTIGDAVRIAVHDRSSAMPCSRNDPCVPGGRGLLILDGVSSGWQAADDGTGKGKWVWCDLPLSG